MASSGKVAYFTAIFPYIGKSNKDILCISPKADYSTTYESDLSSNKNDMIYSHFFLKIINYVFQHNAET